jgi:hypothetical protein
MSDNFQNYTRLYQYIHEYQSLVQDYYSKCGVAYLVTYYNINVNNTVWDNDKIFGGAYERIGNLSGMKWNKYLLIPVYWSEEIVTAFDGDEKGYVKQNETSVVIPSTYNITPYPGDYIKLEQEYLRPTNDIYPIFIVAGIEVYPNTDKRYWKLRIESKYPTTIELEEQVENTFAFFDYTKKIYSIPQSTFLTRMMLKSESTKERLDDLYDYNSGIYFI